MVGPGCLRPCALHSETSHRVTRSLPICSSSTPIYPSRPFLTTLTRSKIFFTFPSMAWADLVISSRTPACLSISLQVSLWSAAGSEQGRCTLTVSVSRSRLDPKVVLAGLVPVVNGPVPFGRVLSTVSGGHGCSSHMWRPRRGSFAGISNVAVEALPSPPTGVLPTRRGRARGHRSCGSRLSRPISAARPRCRARTLPG